jgi:ApbE superfamily uncharacterized protein (UPF0280 family)
MYEERRYRDWVRAEDLVACQVCVDETDLLILADRDVRDAAEALVREVREDLTAYIRRDAEFLTTHRPHAVRHDAPLIARRMAAAAERFEVGPMAAVAGAIAECVGEQLAARCAQLVIENGGDIFVRGPRPLTFSLYAGERSPFSGKLRFTTRNRPPRYGVCTSSGVVGHSFSYGRADAVTIIADSAADADAAATAFANRVQTPEDVPKVIELAAAHPAIEGIVAAKDERLGVWGCVEIL